MEKLAKDIMEICTSEVEQQKDDTVNNKSNYFFDKK